MANNVTELPVKNFDQLDPIDSVQNSDELLIRTGDSYTKRATKINFMKDEVDARTAQDVVLQTHIDDLTSDLAGTTGLAKRDVPNGLASLDSNGLVPASQLPSYVDDVIEGYYNSADGKFYENYTPTVTHDIWTDGTVFFNADTTSGTRPAGTEKSVALLGAARKHSNTFYNRSDNWYEVTAFTSIDFTTSSTAVSTASVIKALNNATDINISYAQYEEGSYSGEITPETGKVYTDLRTKLTYRWGGSAYVIIASDLALGTTHQTAGFGDESRAAYNHSLVRGTGDVTANNPHGLSKADIGLSNVPNVTTNNQTPTYTESQTNEELTSGETLSTAFGKLKKIVKSFIDHINTTLSTNPHNTTKSDVGLGNVTNVATTDQITSGSTNNVTSGAVHTALAGKLGTNETAADSNYAHAIGTPSSHPAIGSSKLPVYVNASGEVTPISTLQVPTIEGNVEFTGNVTTQGDVEIDGGVEVKDDAIFRKDVAIVGNLSVSGVTTIAEQESAIASDYLITRLNNTQGLGQQGHSGIAVNNYQTNKMATMTVDGNGIWRLSASATKTSQTYTNISLFNDVYYDGLTHTTTTGPTHIITNAQSITASDTVWYADDSMYYHYNGPDWLPITSVTNGQFVYGSAVTDSGKIAALEALTKRTLLYYIIVTDNAINESQNQPLLTRDEHSNISNGHLLKWDSTNMRAVDGGDAVRKFDYTMTGTDNVYEDIKALCNQLIALGVNTYAGTFLRSARTYGYYSITVTAADGTILNGTVVIDNEQGRTNSYTVSKVNNDWKIMPTMLNNNILAADCNAVINPGIYAIDNGTTNTPYTGCYGVLETKGYCTDLPSTGAQWIYQSVLDTTGRKFVRHCINPNTLVPTSAQWSPWEEEDVFTQDIIVAPPASSIVGYLSQIKYFLSNADWTKINSSNGYRREFVGSMELQSYWCGTYHLSNFGANYKLMNGTIYGEGQPLRFSAWYDPNYSTGWRVTPSYNYTFVDINGQQYIGDLNQQMSTALDLLAPQTWNAQHCECCIEVLGYFYAMCTFDMRGSYASVYGTILSANQSINGQAFTADFNTTRNYWAMHYTSKVLETAKTWVTTDSNGCVNLNSTMGLPSTAEIISVRAWNENDQGQQNADWMVITQTNSWNVWFAHVASWGGPSVGTTSLYMQVKYRIIVG